MLNKKKVNIIIGLLLLFSASAVGWLCFYACTNFAQVFYKDISFALPELREGALAAASMILLLAAATICCFERGFLSGRRLAGSFSLLLFLCFAAAAFIPAFWQGTMAYFITYEILALLPLAYIGLVNNLTKGCGGRLLFLAALPILNFAFQNILIFTSLLPWTEMPLLTNLLNIAEALLLSILLFTKGGGRPAARAWGYGGIFFALLYGAEILFALADFLFWQLAAMALAATAFAAAEAAAKSFALEKAANEAAAGYALLDFQTGLGSRLAFDKYYYGLAPKLSGEQVFGVIVVDVNNTKDTNDKFGSETGDSMLLAASKLLDRVFTGTGRVFRTGGDEFAVISVPCEADMPALVQSLENKIVEFNTQSIYTLSLAVGLCVETSDVEDKDRLRLIYKTADDRMYEDKIKKHEQLKEQLIQEQLLKRQLEQEQLEREQQFKEQMERVAAAKKAEDFRKNYEAAPVYFKSTENTQKNNMPILSAEQTREIPESARPAEEDALQPEISPKTQAILQEDQARKNNFWGRKHKSKAEKAEQQAAEEK